MNWQKEREMTPRQYKMAVKQLGMTLAGAGRFLGASPRTAFRYASGKAKLRADSVMLLRSMIHHGDQPVVPPIAAED
jgi:hypothetical protein